jgi:hypothetical protein
MLDGPGPPRVVFNRMSNVKPVAESRGSTQSLDRDNTPQYLVFPRSCLPRQDAGRKRDHSGEAVRWPALHPLCILPRSLHLPVAVTEGSLTRNPNRIGARLWTDRPFDEHGEVRCRDTLDAIADGTDGLTRSDQRRGSIRATPAGQAAAVQPLDLEDERRNMRCRVQQLARPPVEQSSRFEDRFDSRTMMRGGGRNIETHDLRRSRHSRVIAQDDRTRPDQQPEFFFEALPRQPGVPRNRQPTRDRRQQRRRTSSFACSAPVGAERAVGL